MEPHTENSTASGSTHQLLASALPSAFIHIESCWVTCPIALHGQMIYLQPWQGTTNPPTEVIPACQYCLLSDHMVFLIRNMMPIGHQSFITCMGLALIMATDDLMTIASNM